MGKVWEWARTAHTTCPCAKNSLRMILTTVTVGSIFLRMNNKECMEDMDHNGDVSWLTDTISCLPHEADSGGEVMNTRVSLSKHFSSRSTTPCEPIPILVYQCLGATHVEDHRVEATQWIHILQVTTMYIHITVFIGLHLSSVTERKLEKLLSNLTGSCILPLKVS